MNHAVRIARQLKLGNSQVAAAIALLDTGNTIPFISRYRKEATGGLDEGALRLVRDRITRLRSVDERRQTIMTAIDAQDKLTTEIQKKLLSAETLTALEDLYQPYKKKRSTRANLAREKGLEPLATLILEQIRVSESLNEIVAPFLNDEVLALEDALAGARDIVAEVINDSADVRERTRQKALKWGMLRCRKSDSVEDKRGVYRLYYDTEYRVDRLRPHQILAINRGEAEKVLRVNVEIAERDWLLPMRTVFRPDHRHSPLAEQMQVAMYDSAKRLLLPAIARDIRRALTEVAETHAIRIFADNLRDLLSQPPLIGHIVLAIDPAYRTGCKVAVVDTTGKVLDTTAIYPHAPQKRWDEALKTLARLVDRFHVSLIAVGNGTASRETEQLVAGLTRKLESVHYLVVNEAGASVYSASSLAGAELPNLDVTLRGAVSIARRVQDPLAELVKIDPKSIGVGLYQHDVNQKSLSEALFGTVESAVNEVGVDVNTASPALLTYVSGIGPKLAERIVEHRNQHGRYSNREQLKDVRGLGSKAFEQSAGFLRIHGGDNPLDASAIHPESYAVATSILNQASLELTTPTGLREDALLELRGRSRLEDMAHALETGVPTLNDIIEQLVRPGRDPRENLSPPILRNDVLSMDDLAPGMKLKGTVRNVVDFGAFVDIGVKQDGLLHRSQIPRREHPNVGDILEVQILKVEQERGRISLGWPGRKK
jgi:uncharacterized protein